MGAGSPPDERSPPRAWTGLQKLDEGDPNAHRLVRCPTTDRPLRYADGTPLQRAPDGRIRRYSRVVHGVPRYVSSQPQ